MTPTLAVVLPVCPLCSTTLRPDAETRPPTLVFLLVVHLQSPAVTKPGSRFPGLFFLFFPAKALVEVVSALIDGARLASRLQGWSESEIEVTRLVGGVVELEAAATVDGTTAIDSFSEVLSAARSENRESVFADRPLLEVCVRFSRVSAAGLAVVRPNGVATDREGGGVTLHFTSG